MTTNRPEASADDWNESHLPSARGQRPLARVRTGYLVDELAYGGPDEAEGEQRGFDLLRLWNVVLRHKLLIGGATIAGVAASLVVTLLTIPIYRATTTIQIERQAPRVVEVKSDLDEGSSANAAEFYETQYGLLKSRALAARVASSRRLGDRPGFLEQARSPLAALTSSVKSEKAGSSMTQEQRMAAATGLVQHNLSIAPVRMSGLVQVSYDSPDPQLSADVANAAAKGFIESQLERRFEASSYARQFLESRLAQLKQKLEDSERQLVAYAAQQRITNVSGQDAKGNSVQGQSLSATSLAGINSALTIAQAQRVEAEQRWRQSQASSGTGRPDALAAVQPLRQLLGQAQAEYQERLSTFKPDYPEMVQRKARITELERQIQMQLEGQASAANNALKNEYIVARNRENELRGQVTALTSSVLNERGRSIQYDILQRELDTSRQLYDGLLQRYKEIGVAGGVGTNNVSVVDSATAGRRVKPDPKRNLMFGVLLGAAVGFGLALLLEFLDDTIKVPEDLQTKLHLALLGGVPAPPKGVTPQVALADARSSLSEAYYSVRTALQFSGAGGVPRSLLITSARPGEGKSTTALALARNFARLGIRVLIVDADLRNPSLHKQLGQSKTGGLTNFLVGAAELPELIQIAENEPAFLAAGPLPPNPAEILSGSRIQALLEQTTDDYDLVIFDGPPVLGLADAPQLANQIAGTLLVIEAGKTRRGFVLGALRRLHAANAQILGGVLTKFNAKQAGYGYGYAYQYEYQYGGRPKLVAADPA